MRVFLCHSSSDKPVVKQVASHFPEAIQSWLDEREMKVGEDIKQALATAIQSSSFLIPFISGRSIASEWVQHELQLAMSREAASKIVIMPILIEAIQDLPDYLRERKCLTLIDRSESAVRAVAKKIAEDVCAWTMHQEPFIRTFDDHPEEVRAIIAEECQKHTPGASRIAYYALPKIISTFKAGYRHSVLGEKRLPDHPPLWLVHCLHAVVQMVKFDKPGGPETPTQSVHQACLIGYHCARFGFGAGHAPKRELSGKMVSIEAGRVIEDLKSDKDDKLCALPAHDAAQTIVEAFMNITFKDVDQSTKQKIHHVLASAAFMGSVYAEAERRLPANAPASDDDVDDEEEETDYNRRK
jgi:hypothetical protein